MRAYWIKFTDGSKACCEGETDYDARRIAEKLTGKTVDGPKYEAGPNVKPLPYPASPAIWQMEHPVHGKTPKFCFAPDQCCGRTACPQNYSCTE
jgi:hypothetical protein